MGFRGRVWVLGVRMFCEFRGRFSLGRILTLKDWNKLNKKMKGV
jgi:hypothetical protein